MHPNVGLITGMICGYRIEEIEDPIMQKVRYLDKPAYRQAGLWMNWPRAGRWRRY